MAHLDFIYPLHNKTKRNYLQRVTEHDKAECAEVATQFGKDYWDGDRKYGFGGYHYDGRWRALAQKFVDHFQLPANAKILDVGCGKGFLLFELSQILPEAQVTGLDISQYALDHAKPEVKPFLQWGDAQKLPFANGTFDFVYSITTLHNLLNFELFSALQEIERVGKQKKYIVMESYRNEREKANLLYWQLTCRSFYKPEEWEWLFQKSGYTGDYELIYFE